MTPRERSEDQTADAELRANVKKILLHVAGGIGPDGETIKGLGEIQREQGARIDRIDAFIESTKRLIIGVALGVATLVLGAWAMLGFGPHPPTPPGHP